MTTAAAAAPANPFDALLAEIGVVGSDMNKAQSDQAAAVEATDDDAAIAAAAGENAGGEDTSEGKKKDDVTGDDTPPELGKSFAATLADGSTVEAVDATELLKSLITRVELGEVKSVEINTGLLAVVKSQGEMLKSFGARLETLANSGRKRASVVTVVEKPAAAAAVEAAPDGISLDEFWGKAMAANAKGVINATDIAKIESHINNNMQPPAELLARIALSEKS